ncbi:MAG: chromosome segregation protein SMC [Bdellovibrionales bacterium]|nr:chromosome segregation protein SMC [Bdellovibrionales bacterium]
MRIKHLQVTGFKSFLDKTTLSFNVPITGIVGPNGCGKSNVVDALKWVTGELSYKQLRGKNSEDLIFAGSDRRPPSSMMEVQLTLDNTERLAPSHYNEYAEITVLRRIFRDGTSEFFINKTPCRLRDINDLFLDTGIGQSSYSIIEQGKVGAIVSGRPEDRRLMIEEAAGITKYKQRKKAALRKLDSTKQNLLRVTDIVKELEKQIASLERQAKKAEKFTIAKKEFETLDIKLSAYEYTHFQSQKETLLQTDDESQVALTQLSAKLQEVENQFEIKRIEVDELERSFQASQQELFSKKSSIQEVEHEIGHCKSSIANSERQIGIDQEKITKLEKDILSYNERLSAIELDLENISTKKQSIQAELEEKMSLFEGRKGELNEIEQNLDQSKKSHIQTVTRKTECKSKIESLKEQIVHLEKDYGEINEELASVVDEITHAESEADEQKILFDQVQQMCFGFQENQQQLEDQIADTENYKMQVEEQLQEITLHLQEKESRLQALVEFTKTYQGYTKTVQNLMKRQHSDNPFQSVMGVLGELIHIEEGYEKCVQAVLSDWIESVIVDSFETSKDVFAFLKEEQKSRALILTKHTSSQNVPTLQDASVLGSLSSWVDISSVPSVASKLINVYVVENLTSMIELGKKYPQYSFVTKEGDYLEEGGMLHVGPWTEAHGDLEIRQEIEAIKTQIEPIKDKKRTLVEEKEKVDRTFEKLTGHLEQVQADIKNENQKSTELGLTLQKIANKIEFLTKQKAQKVTQTENIKVKMDQADGEIEKISSDLSNAETQMNDLESTIEVLTKNYQESKQAFETYQQDIHSYQIHLTSVLEKFEGLQRERSQIQSTLELSVEQKKSLSTETSEHSENITVQKQKIAEFETQLANSLTMYEDQEKVNSDLRITHDELNLSLNHLQEDLKQLRRSKEDQQAGLNQVRVTLSEVSIKMENLQNQVREIYEKELVDCISEFSDDESLKITPENVTEYKEQREELKDRVHKFGNVNLAALDEIGELKDRFVFLSTQKEDLEKSLESLHDAIKTINKTTKEKFETTYQEVNERFQKIFPRLFRGGKARLVMVDPENILESGVDIFAQPPGKKLQNMNLLSGGEKALTAIALLFSIFEYKAPPFCVLDEVDAPLDDANVLRYVAMVKEMSQKTQFIVITHNKSSMHMANNLYGVTMEEPGVSRTVSVRLDQEHVLDQETIFEAKSVA